MSNEQEREWKLRTGDPGGYWLESPGIERLFYFYYAPDADRAERILNALSAQLSATREALERSGAAIEWLRNYASGFEAFQANRGWKASAEVLAKSDELDALLADIAALSSPTPILPAAKEGASSE